MFEKRALTRQVEEMQSTHCRRAILVISMFGYLTHPRCAGENRKLVYAGYLWVCGAPGEYMRTSEKGMAADWRRSNIK